MTAAAGPAAALFAPLALGVGLTLPNRIIMAPMTRQRAAADGTATPLMAAYYAQRASAGLVLTDCTMVGPLAHAYEHCPGLYSPGQVEGWRRVTDAVHERDGRIFAQLWHCGRRSHPLLLGGEPPVAPSPVPSPEEIRTPEGELPAPVPRELSAAEIGAVVGQFEAAARNAREAGFDGVELHGANGYLIDQFLRTGANRRADRYGGAIPNRVRFLAEVVEAVTGVWGPDRVGVKLSPGNGAKGMADEDPRALFEHAVSMLNGKGLAYLHLSEPKEAKKLRETPLDSAAGSLASAHFRRLFAGRLMVDTGYDRGTGDAAVREGMADLVAFGRPFIANPDLPERLRVGAPLNTADPDTFYGGDARGYTDYPSLAPTAVPPPRASAQTP